MIVLRMIVRCASGLSKDGEELRPNCYKWRNKVINIHTHSHR